MAICARRDKDKEACLKKNAALVRQHEIFKQ